MPKYRVYGVVIGSKLIGEYEAETPEQAKNMAADSDENYVSLCHQCAKEIDDAQVSDAHDYQVEEVET